MERRTVVYEEPAPFTSLLAQNLREEDVDVAFDPPVEDRGIAQEWRKEALANFDINLTDLKGVLSACSKPPASVRRPKERSTVHGTPTGRARMGYKETGRSRNVPLTCRLVPVESGQNWV